MEGTDDGVESDAGFTWKNPWIAEFKEREQILKATRGYELAEQVRMLNFASYAFGGNTTELQNHLSRYPAIFQSGQKPPLDPDVGDPFTVELSRLLLNALGAASALISGQRAILRDVWPKVGRDPSEFEQGPYTEKRLELFVEIEAKLIVDLRNYAQHKFLPKLDATTYWSTQIPLGELRFMLSTKPLLEWDRLSAPVREYLKAAGDSVDLLPIYQRYTVSVREFFKWFWLQVEDAMRAERAEIKAHGEELNAFAEDVFLAPDWFQNGGEPPANWATIAPRWRRTRKAKIRLKRAEIGHTSVRGIAVDSDGNATVGEHPWTPITTRVP
ncbi:hypothetical protein MPRF_26380 [Mycolicibacterium parafortuitum]|uniref:Uncharacterized protein n=1 Tax=Mycolicibacterium parafortuitum TaxID=39692 RepID=A0A7I7U573_MYCPF|nr:hypothetical protein [Mycolicibacterium parafortuitum]BBY75739.1 hypothetical protein MPRF_26380 [Mycolicibacterium parafortuitum]